MDAERVDDMLHRLDRAGEQNVILAGALVNALRAGRPGLAAVDVYEEEPVLDLVAGRFPAPTTLTYLSILQFRGRRIRERPECLTL